MLMIRICTMTFMVFIFYIFHYIYDFYYLYCDLHDFYVSYGFHNLHVSLFSDLRDFYLYYDLRDCYGSYSINFTLTSVISILFTTFVIFIRGTISMSIIIYNLAPIIRR